MKKNEIFYIEECPNLKEIMEQFCNAKQAVYQYSLEEFAKKKENFYKNIQSIRISNDSSAVRERGSFVRNIGRISLLGNLYKEKDSRKFTNSAMQSLIHELNHAWNYEKGKRIGIINTPFTVSRLILYKTTMEAINEAEAQILCSKSLKIDDKLYQAEEAEFQGYKEAENTVFKTLCIICNQDGIDFIKNIDGMVLEDLASYIATRTGQSIEDVNSYMKKFYSLQYEEYKEYKSSYEIKKIYSKKLIEYCKQRKKNGEKFFQALTNGMIDLEENQDEILSLVEWNENNPWQKSYELTKQFIENCHYTDEEKEVCLQKLSAVQEKINILNVYRFCQKGDLNQFLKKHPNLQDVHYDEYEKTSQFRFGRLNLPELLVNSEFEKSWEERVPNEVENSIMKGNGLFSKVKISSLKNLIITMKNNDKIKNEESESKEL